MADWEPLAGAVFAGVILTTWPPWVGDVVRVNRLAAPKASRLVLALTSLVCLLFLLVCIWSASPSTVHEGGLNLAIDIAFGVAALGVSAHLSGFLGISARDDVLERGNVAALIAVAGALSGATFCIVGGTLGGRTGILSVAVAAGASLSAWWALWYASELFGGGRVAERITIERDLGAGVRLCGLLVANGVILGAASAGEWRLSRFALSAWPALVLIIIAALLERLVTSRSFIGRSVLAALCYVILAILWVFRGRFGV